MWAKKRHQAETVEGHEHSAGPPDSGGPATLRKLEDSVAPETRDQADLKQRLRRRIAEVDRGADRAGNLLAGD